MHAVITLRRGLWPVPVLAKRVNRVSTSRKNTPLSSTSATVDSSNLPCVSNKDAVAGKVSGQQGILIDNIGRDELEKML